MVVSRFFVGGRARAAPKVCSYRFLYAQPDYDDISDDRFQTVAVQADKTETKKMRVSQVSPEDLKQRYSRTLTKTLKTLKTSVEVT